MSDFDESFDSLRFPVLRFLQTRLFLKALLVAVPNGIFSAVLAHYVPDSYRNTSAVGVSQVWTGYNFVLGFLIVFRTTHAYGRFWEGATLLHQMRGEWFNAISSLIAFSSAAPEKRQEVIKFQNFVIRLASMLHCAALQEVSVMEVKKFETIEVEGIDPDALQFLQSKVEKSEVLLQWIQRLVVEAHVSGVVPIAPPILSRVFQELSRGIVNLNSAKRITDVPFPLPYTLMLKLMLGIQWVITPMICSLVLENWFLAGILSMITVFAFWSTVHIAAEIENPFGDDQCDLPLTEFQFSFNKSLLALLDTRAQNPPFYSFTDTRGSSGSAESLDAEYALFVPANYASDSDEIPKKTTTAPLWLRPIDEAGQLARRKLSDLTHISLTNSLWLKKTPFIQPRRTKSSYAAAAKRQRASRSSNVRSSRAPDRGSVQASGHIGALHADGSQLHTHNTPPDKPVSEALASAAPSPAPDQGPALQAQSPTATREEKWSGKQGSKVAVSRSPSPSCYEGSNCVVWAINSHVESATPPLLAFLDDPGAYEGHESAPGDQYPAAQGKELHQAAEHAASVAAAAADAHDLDSALAVRGVHFHEVVGTRMGKYDEQPV